MNATANFELATRQKFRFATAKGGLSVEDLWDLPLTASTGQPSLDSIAILLNRQLKETNNEISFVTPSPSTSKETERMAIKLEIVKHVIQVKIAERDARQEAAARADKKQKVLEILSRKKDAALEGASVEDLEKLLNEL